MPLARSRLRKQGRTWGHGAEASHVPEGQMGLTPSTGTFISQLGSQSFGRNTKITCRENVTSCASESPLGSGPVAGHLLWGAVHLPHCVHRLLCASYPSEFICLSRVKPNSPKADKMLFSLYLQHPARCLLLREEKKMWISYLHLKIFFSFNFIEV